MADYYPILARAVAGLPHDDAQARQDLYTRARSIVAEQLRGRGLGSGTSEGLREQAALESAIRKIEAEAQPATTPTKGEPRPARAAGSRARERADKTATSLAKILQAVQPGDISEMTPPATKRKSSNAAPANRTHAAAPAAEPKASETRDAEIFNVSAELGDAASSFGTLLFATAYIVAALAFTGVTYIRSIVWLYQGVIGYPMVLAIMVVTLALFIVPPVLIFRKTSALPTIDDLLRFIHSASRRML